MTRELTQYEIDKKYEVSERMAQQKLEMSSMVKVGNENLASISLLADKFSKAGDLIPKEFQANPEKCFVAIYKGASLGLDAFTSLQRIAVINGRATIWGDTALSLVRKSGLMVKFEEIIDETDTNNMIARCTVQRNGEAVHISEYSQKEAVLAGLWGNNVWKKYPKRMLKYRARAFALRDIFADVLDGLYLKEEIEGGEDFKNVTPSNLEPTSNQQKIKNIASANSNWYEEAQKMTKGKEESESGAKPEIIHKYEDYDSLLDHLCSCESLGDIEAFEKDFSKDLKNLKKTNQEDYSKLSKMIEAKKEEFKLSSELNVNLNQ